MQMINITLFGEMLTFIVLIFVTMKYIWPPIIKAINDRQQKIAQGLEAAERGQHNLELARNKAVQILQDSKIQASNIIEQANNQVTSIIEQGKIKAGKEAAKIQTLAQADLKKNVIAAKQQLQQQTTVMAVQLTEKILCQKMDAALNQKLIEQMLAEIK